MAACSGEMLPLGGTGGQVGAGFNDAGQVARRAEVELFVKSNHPTLIADIQRGGGATLDQAFDVASVPDTDRPTRVIQLQSDLGLYQSAPSALIASLLLYGA